MPKLNLDIFGQQDSPAHRETKSEPKTEGSVHVIGHAGAPVVPPQVEKAARNDKIEQESPRFVPVGFHVEQLRRLDEAVIQLRREKYWQASKSGIIRCLIDLHADDLAGVWRRQTRQRRGPDSSAP